MTTDIEVRQPAGELETRTPTTNDLVEWALAARQAHEIALQLAETSFVPKSMYRRPGEVTGAILAGRELGLEPMVALRSIDIIDGTPAMRAHALRGLVQAHGHEVWVEESTEHRAIVCGRRRRSVLSGSAPIERSVWTMDRARKAGLAGKKNWLAHPTAMLVARATAEVCRLIAADVLLGMPYSVEEIDDGVTLAGAAEAAATPASGKPKRRTAQRAPLAPPPPPADVDFDTAPRLEEGTAEACPVDAEPLPDDVPPPQPEESTAVEILEAAGFDVEVIEEEAPEVEMVTDPQRRRLGAEFRQAGVTERAARLAFVARVIGREVPTSNELTKVEASKVIQALVDLPQSGEQL